MPSFGAVDLGATNIRALVAGGAGEERGRAERSTPAADGATIAASVVATLERACDDAGVAPASLAAVGVGTIGPLDADAGAVVGSPNVPAERIDLAAALRDRTGAPVTLHNDAVAGALGERRFGGLPEHGIYLTCSTGVGAGAVVDGHVLRGWRGNAAEVGHLTLVPDGRPCGCGGAGHWEAYCSGTGVAGHARDLARESAAPTALDPETLDAATVFESAGADAPAVAAGEVAPTAAGGDPLATRVVAAAIRLNARGVAALAHAYAPEVVSVGGAVALANADLVVEPLDGRLDDADLAVPAPTVRLTPLGADAVLRGALASVLPDDHKA